MVADDCSATFVSSLPPTTTLCILNSTQTPAYGGTCTGQKGSIFDSGINPSSGLAKMGMELGYYGSSYQYIIKRFHLTFNDGSTTTDAMHHGYTVDRDGKNSVRIFTLPPNDSISSITIWFDDICVHAIQYTLESGVKSPMFGTPGGSSATSTHKATTNTLNKTILGIHGRYGGVMHKLGFTIGDVVLTEVGSSTQEECIPVDIEITLEDRRDEVKK